MIIGNKFGIMKNFPFFFQINDRRQFAEFQSQLNQTKNAVNIMPNDIYKSPITKFENPTFGSEEKYKWVNKQNNCLIRQGRVF